MESSASPVIRSFTIDDLRYVLRRLIVLKLRSLVAVDTGRVPKMVSNM